jgi:GAF domain
MAARRQRISLPEAKLTESRDAGGFVTNRRSNPERGQERMASPAQNPWLAINVATDPVAHARLLRRAHECALTGGSTLPIQVREVVLNSWKRSLAAGVAPDQAGAPLRLTSEQLSEARERSPLAHAVDVIEATLSELDADARHIVAIADAQANLLWVTGNPDTCERAREMHFEAGAAWSEGAAGTNAVGTAAALDHPVQIFSAEHLVEAVHPWTCSAAPIHDPVTGKLIGVIDLTAELKTIHPHTLSLASLAARAAEAALQLRAINVAERLKERWQEAIAGRRTPSALLDANGRVIASQGVEELPERVDLRTADEGRLVLPGGRVGELEALDGQGAILWLRRRPWRQASHLRLQLLGHDAAAQLGTRHRESRLRSLELLAVLAMHPEGMTTEQLALSLYGERGNVGTIRAQVHRVRRWAGPGALGGHPYTLTVPVQADWLEVRRLVAMGRPRAALQRYRGPLLPGSDAPEIVEVRALLEESLRRAILTSAKPDLLSRWLAHPSGADDLAAARALVAVLPAGDPRRAAATASAAAIRRRLELKAA